MADAIEPASVSWRPLGNLVLAGGVMPNTSQHKNAALMDQSKDDAAG